MDDTNTIRIDLEEYKEFIISQYKNGQLKETLIDEIDNLEKDKENLAESINKLNEDLLSKRNAILDLAYAKNVLEYHDRHAGCNINLWTFLYAENEQTLIDTFGFTTEELVAYAHKLYDKKEKKKAETE